MSQETFKLIFTNGPREGDQIPLGDSITTLGRSKRNTIILDDPSISREHLRFYVDDDQVSIEDAGSSRGTLVNGQALTGKVQLKHGDELDVGKQQIKVVSLSETLDGDDEVTLFENFDDIEEKFNSESQIDFKQAKVRVEGKTAKAPMAPAVSPAAETAKVPVVNAPVAADDDDDRTRVVDVDKTRAYDAKELISAVNAGQMPAPVAAPRKSIAVPLLIGLIIFLALAIGAVYVYQAIQAYDAGPSPKMQAVPGATPGSPAVEAWDYQPVRVAPEAWQAKVDALKAEGWTMSSEPKMETDAEGKSWMVSLFKKPK